MGPAANPDVDLACLVLQIRIARGKRSDGAKQNPDADAVTVLGPISGFDAVALRQAVIAVRPPILLEIIERIAGHRLPELIRLLEIAGDHGVEECLDCFFFGVETDLPPDEECDGEDSEHAEKNEARSLGGRAIIGCVEQSHGVSPYYIWRLKSAMLPVIITAENPTKISTS